MRGIEVIASAFLIPAKRFNHLSRPEFCYTNSLLLFVSTLFLRLECLSFAANFCRTTVPLLLGVSQALGVSSVYVSDPSLITKLLFPNHSGHATPKEPQLPRALSRAAPRRFLSFPEGKRDDSYHLSDAQLSSVITRVGTLYTAISRKVVGKKHKSTRDNPEK